jgi:hypothetical protein
VRQHASTDDIKSRNKESLFAFQREPPNLDMSAVGMVPRYHKPPKGRNDIIDKNFNLLSKNSIKSQL